MTRALKIAREKLGGKEIDGWSPTADVSRGGVVVRES